MIQKRRVRVRKRRGGGEVCVAALRWMGTLRWLKGCICRQTRDLVIVGEGMRSFETCVVQDYGFFFLLDVFS